MSEFITVAKVGDIPPGEGRAYEYHDQMVAVFNDHGDYRAIDDMCPHMGASLAAGHLEGCVVSCPWHGWRFDTRDGSWCDNPRLTIDVYRVRVVGDEIQIAALEKPIGDPGELGGSALGGSALGGSALGGSAPGGALPDLSKSEPGNPNEDENE